jgi:asparagine synthase (glutamine-hydrolysing)
VRVDDAPRPDDEGLYLSGGVGLGMRRLSIIDLEGGHQPVANEDRSVWVVFNGEIYNYRALRRDLERRGHVFSTASDTETIVHLYEEHGVHCVDHLRGMFAIAIWDTRRRQMLLARDRLGIKPLYYAESDGELAVRVGAQADPPARARAADSDWGACATCSRSSSRPRTRAS